MIRFSVVIPSYNRADFLIYSVQSVLSQSYTNFEIIVVDDGSTDKTSDIVKQWSNDQRFHYIKTTNGGVCNARNTGAKLSKGEYLVFLDSDDAVTNNWLFEFNVCIEKTGADFVQCGMKKVINNTEELLFPIIGKAAGSRGVKFNIPGSFAIKKQIFIDAGMYDTNLKFGENTELFFRIKPWNLQHAIVSAPNFIYTPHPEGGAKNRTNRIAANLYVINKHADFFDAHKDLKQQYLQVAGVDSSIQGHYFNSMNYLINGWLARPFFLKSFLRVLIGFVPFLSQKVWKNKHFNS